MTRKLLIITLFAFASFLTFTKSVHAKSHAQVSAFIIDSTVAPGQKTRLGLRMEIDAGWHTYYENAGDSGLGTQLKVETPDLATLSELEYPTPHRIQVGNLTNFGYGGTHATEIYLLADFTISEKAAPGQNLEIPLSANWLICQSVCIPEKASLKLTVPITKKTGTPNPYLRTVFSQASERLPKRSNVVSMGHLSTGEIRVQASIPKIIDAIPITKKAIIHSALPVFARSENETSIRFFFDPRWIEKNESSPTLEWILLTDSDHSIRFKTSQWKKTPFDQALTPIESSGLKIAPKISFAEILRMIMFAWIGGLVLNLMPCVFPVLSLKALSVLRVEKHSYSEIRIEGLFYTLGILVSFWVLAGSILLLRSRGDDLGWGFQLQNSHFVFFLFNLFFAMGLNLLGVFEFNFAGVTAPLQNRIASRTQAPGPVQAFLTGVLAVLVATPCTAPFMGVALGFALTQPTGIALAIFTALGLGLAMPFLFLSLTPQVGRFFPKPGAWMQTIKELLSIPLFGTVIWLGWVFSLQIPKTGFTLVVVTLALSTAVLFTLGTRQKIIIPKIKLALVFLGVFSLLIWVNRPTPKPLWKPYSESAAMESLKAGHPVFVDFTAAWCITCQVNQKSTLDLASTQKFFSEHHFDLYLADWTDADPEITRRLEHLGRSGVPVYWVRTPQKPGKDFILPQVLTSEILKHEISQALDPGQTH